MKDVGEPSKCIGGRRSVLKVKLVLSLNKLHLLGYFHGDARVYNAVLVSNRILWVDFVFGEAKSVCN